MRAGYTSVTIAGTSKIRVSTRTGGDPTYSVFKPSNVRLRQRISYSVMSDMGWNQQKLKKLFWLWIIAYFNLFIIVPLLTCSTSAISLLVNSFAMRKTRDFSVTRNRPRSPFSTLYPSSSDTATFLRDLNTSSSFYNKKKNLFPIDIYIS